MADNIEQRVNDVEKRQAVLDAKFDAFIQEMRDFKQEMRQQNEMRANEIMELRRETDSKIDKINQKFDKIDQKFDKIDEKFDRLEAKIDDGNRHSYQMFIAVSIGIGAIILALAAPLISSMFRSTEETKIAPQPAVQMHIERMPSDELQPKD